jgi:spore germination cell wall hydrolase CwlJ-like protein
MNPVPYDQLPEMDLLKLCCWREARGEDRVGQLGVIYVILNRVKEPMWWGNSVRTVILKPFQFSSFNPDDPNQDKWPADDDPSYPQINNLVLGVAGGQLLDPTGGAQWYHDTSIPPPKWTIGLEMCLATGHLRFYRKRPPTGALDLGDVAVDA